MRKALVKLLQLKKVQNLLVDLPEEVITLEFYEKIKENFKKINKKRAPKIKKHVLQSNDENFSFEKEYSVYAKEATALLKVNKKTFYIQNNYVGKAIFVGLTKSNFPLYIMHGEESCLYGVYLTKDELKRLIYLVKNPDMINFT